MAKIRIESDGACRNVVLTRPEKRNALDAQMLEMLLETFTAEPGEGERVVVVRSEGQAFCAGLDLKELRGQKVGSGHIEKVLQAIETYPLPVVAVVQGDAVAGGNELALACDLVVASTNAAFGMTLAKIGVAPSWFLVKKLLETAGPVVTREILLLGELLPAQRMYDLGIICRVVPKHRLEPTAQELVHRLATNAPLALQAMKKLLVRQMAFRDGIEHEDVDALVTQVRQSADAEEGIAAQLEYRPARFAGE